MFHYVNDAAYFIGEENNGSENNPNKETLEGLTSYSMGLLKNILWYGLWKQTANRAACFTETNGTFLLLGKTTN